MELLKTYTSNQFAKRIGISAPTFVKWEAHFTNLSPSLDAQGKRYYTDEDAKVWIRIVKMVKEEKMSLEAIQALLCKEDLFKKEKLMAIRKLENIRNFFTNMAGDLK